MTDDHRLLCRTVNTYCTHDCPTPCLLSARVWDRLPDGADTRDMAYEAGCSLKVPEDAQSQRVSRALEPR